MMRKEVRVRELFDGSKGIVEMQLPNIKKYGSTCWQVEQPRRGGGTFFTPETRSTPPLSKRFASLLFFCFLLSRKLVTIKATRRIVVLELSSVADAHLIAPSVKFLRFETQKIFPHLTTPFETEIPI